MINLTPKIWSFSFEALVRSEVFYTIDPLDRKYGWDVKIPVDTVVQQTYLGRHSF